jgi:hypothetical protein
MSRDDDSITMKVETPVPFVIEGVPEKDTQGVR